MTFGWRHLLGAGAAAAALGVLVYLSGVMPIRASSGHWPITVWFLENGMRRAVATQSLGIRAPAPLDDPDLVVLGAGAYEASCAPCHGAPGEPIPDVAAAMLPPPPELRHAAEAWTEAQLYTIVRHGIRFTGMPAWPADRDDEPWAVVAFLRALPELDASGYAALVGRPVEVPEEVPAVVGERCAGCHGEDGLGVADLVPRLAGQRAAYLEASLAAYAEGERPSGIMEPQAVPLTAEERRAIARYYAALPAPPATASDPAAAARGEQLAAGGPGMPACAECHGPAEHPRNALYPELAGQPEAYLRRQLHLFASGRRGGSRMASVMATVARRGEGPHQHLTEAQMADLAAYYRSLPHTERAAVGSR